MGSWIIEDGNVKEEEVDGDKDKNENNDDLGVISYTLDEEVMSDEDVIRDRTTGPAFDINLNNEKSLNDLGQGVINYN